MLYLPWVPSWESYLPPWEDNRARRMRSGRVSQSCINYMAVRVVSYQAFPGHIVCKSDNSQNNKCTIFISKPPPQTRPGYFEQCCNFLSLSLLFGRRTNETLVSLSPGSEKADWFTASGNAYMRTSKDGVRQEFIFFPPQGWLAPDNILKSFSSHVTRFLLYWKTRIRLIM